MYKKISLMFKKKLTTTYEFLNLVEAPREPWL